MELLVSLAVAATVMALVISVLIYIARGARGVAMQDLATVYGRTALENIKNSVRTGTRFTVTDNGNRVDITNADGSVTSYYYEASATSSTIPNNRIMFRSAANAQPRSVIRYVNPPTSPIFSTLGGVGAPLTIRMRLGDARHTTGLKPASRYHAVDIETTVGVRNQ